MKDSKQHKQLIRRPCLLLLALAALVMTHGSGAAAAESGATVGDINRGASTWSQVCGRCHNLRPPTEFRDDLWRAVVTHMRVRAGLTGQQQRDVLAFLQASNNPALVSVPAVSSAPVSAGPALSGQAVYQQTCVACHGADGKGSLPGTPDFTAAEGPLNKPDEVLIKHITEGFESPGAAMAMPANGGNAALTGADISNVLEYLRASFEH